MPICNLIQLCFMISYSFYNPSICSIIVYFLPTKIKERERNQIVVGSMYNSAEFIAEQTGITLHSKGYMAIIWQSFSLK